MKIYKLMAVAVAGLALSVATTKATISLDFSSTLGLPTSKIQFDGLGNFSFTPSSSGSHFTIGGSSGVGDSVLDTGTIGGTFAIGTITTILGVSTAPVTGLGTLSIFDGLNTLTGNLSWNSIKQEGTGNSLNISGLINLTGITYGGTQSDLAALASGTLGSQVVAFTFNPAKTLAQLAGVDPSGVTYPLTATYSGSITSAVPEPTTVIAGALLLLPFGIGAIRSLRKDRTT